MYSMVIIVYLIYNIILYCICESCYENRVSAFSSSIITSYILNNLFVMNFSLYPWRRERLPTPVFWPRESGYN